MLPAWSLADAISADVEPEVVPRFVDLEVAVPT
jgi:hypothetical protein